MLKSIKSELIRLAFITLIIIAYGQMDRNKYVVATKNLVAPGWSKVSKSGLYNTFLECTVQLEASQKEEYYDIYMFKPKTGRPFSCVKYWEVK